MVYEGSKNEAVVLGVVVKSRSTKLIALEICWLRVDVRGYVTNSKT